MGTYDCFCLFINKRVGVCKNVVYDFDLIYIPGSNTHGRHVDTSNDQHSRVSVE